MSAADTDTPLTLDRSATNSASANVTTAQTSLALGQESRPQSQSQSQSIPTEGAREEESGAAGGQVPQEGESSSGGSTRRIPKSSLPPGPPGPPPSGPPPLPPNQNTTTVPTVDASTGQSTGPSTNSTTVGRQPRSAVHPFRRAGSTSPTPPPSLPPPTGALPAIPIVPHPTSSKTGTGSIRSAGSSPRSSTHRRSTSPPPKPSPRTSSLSDPFGAAAAAGPSNLGPGVTAGMTTLRENAVSPSPSQVGSKPRTPRTPSRHLLQTALDLAQRAVEMDKNNDVIGALEAYREAVSRLKSVMERVGVEPGKDGGKARRNVTGKSEEEGRTLKGIHDAYVARIQLLISYETGDQPPSTGTSPSEAFIPTNHPSVSTATLVPDQFSRSPQTEPSTSGTTGERTPRPSLDETDETTQKFQRLSVDLNEDTIHRSTSPGLAPIPQQPSESGSGASDMLRNNNLGGISVPPRGASQGMGLAQGPAASAGPSTPARDRSSNNSSPSDMMSPTSSTRSRSSRRRPPRPSMGLESELDLQISEGEEGMEVLEKTPQLGGPSSSRVTTGDSDMPSPRRLTDAFDTDRPLPPLPSSSSGRSMEGDKPVIHARQASLGRNANMLVSPSTAQGTISQRRQVRNMSPVKSGSELQRLQSIEGLPSGSGAGGGGISFPSRNSSTSQSTVASSIFPQRLRTRSQPGRAGTEEVPPLPTPSIRHQSSFGSQQNSVIASLSRGLRSGNDPSRLDSGALAPPMSSSPLSSASIARSLAPGSIASGASASGSLMSPLPESQPSEIMHRPFHLLRLLQRSMDPNSSGSYLTAKLHISSAIWKPAIWPKTSPGSKTLGPPKIIGQEAKVRVMETLIHNIGMMSRSGFSLLQGPRDYSAGEEAMVDPNLSKAMTGVVDEFCMALDALEDKMDQAHKLLTKSGVTVGAWKGKKSGNAQSWGSKLTKTMDKITNNKAMESPDRYVDLLSNFCIHVQIIGEHLACVTGPCTLAYSGLSEKSYNEVRARLLRSSDFVSVVVVPWLLDDFKQFFLRYLKGGVRYMED